MKDNNDTQLLDMIPFLQVRGGPRGVCVCACLEGGLPAGWWARGAFGAAGPAMAAVLHELRGPLNLTWPRPLAPTNPCTHARPCTRTRSQMVALTGVRDVRDVVKSYDGEPNIGKAFKERMARLANKQAGSTGGKAAPAAPAAPSRGWFR